MNSLHYTTNWNGRLILPVFQDIRPHTGLMVGDKVEVSFKGTKMGIAEVKELRVFPLPALTNSAAWAVTGAGGANYLRAILHKMFGADIAKNENLPMALATLKWVSRDLNVLSDMLREYYDSQFNKYHQLHQIIY